MQPPAETTAETAADLFARAAAARRDAEHETAARLYGEVRARFPGSREAAMSCVALGRLLLDRLGDPAGALEAFDAYRTADPGGTMAEEALVGRALALMRLRRTPEERAAWAELLARHPASANAERARRRLAETGGGAE